ncbi:MAG: aminotransferase class I/II-fold pyridoxal phosphate-dependent enzyme [bacterium]
METLIMQDIIKEKKVRKINSDNHTIADFYSLKNKDLFVKTKPCFEYITDWQKKGTYTLRRTILSESKNRVIIYDEYSGRKREMIMMASNNYLGLSTHPKVKEAAIEAIRKYGSGMSGSPILNGTFNLLKKLEEKLAQLKGCEEAMLFSTGYSTNVGAISGLIRSEDVIIIDRLNHASIIDGCILAKANFRIFKHNDMQSLESVLKKIDGEFMGKLIAVDGIFSMEGDLASLPDIVELADRYSAKIMVDEAHATGVIGDHGGGATEYFNLKGKIDLVMGTFSKTFATTGGYIASNKEVINYLRHFARSYLFSASLTPSVVATVLAGLEVLEKEPQLRIKLWNNIKYMHDNLKGMGYNVFPSPPESAILILPIGKEVKLRQMSRKIHEEGIFLNAIPYPAVAKDKSRFRISLMATHTREDLDKTLDVLEKVGKEFDVI